MINLSCAGWEAGARDDYVSFAGVQNITLEDPNCVEIQRLEGTTRVECTGKMIADYGVEDLVVDLPELTFKVIHQDGENLMCGYVK